MARFYDNRIFMSQSVQRKRRGRPATGTTPLVGVRMRKELQQAIRVWAQKQTDQPNFAVAVRRLIERSLARKQ